VTAVKFSKVLIANRGEIACRIARTLRRLGIRPVAVFSEADAGSLHVSAADEAHCIGPAPSASSYLDAARILETARACGAEAVHPGYGFLSENAAFAEACGEAGIRFIGPTPAQIRDFGLKHTARKLAEESGVPLLPGTGLLEGPEEARIAAERIGYPVILKSTAGGGGIGMQVCKDAVQLASAWETVSRLSQSNFKHAGIYLEKYVANARHVEVQVFGDGKGKVISLGERDCSAQRRNQKVIEETPAPGLDGDVRAALHRAAEVLGRKVAYRSAGTVEFVLDADTGRFYFLEVNTRLQVEHGVTEEVAGIDLVEWMVRLAADDLPDLDSLKPAHRGHSIQARVYAENPRLDFRPSAGQLTEAVFPASARVDTWVEAGSEVSPFYDPLLAKVIVKGPDRAAALEALGRALDSTRLEGIETNLEFLRSVCRSDAFREGVMTTRYLAGYAYPSLTVDVLQPGAQTTVQDHPGRIGYWDVGVPPSGPMDSLAFRLVNRLLGNAEAAAGLELTVSGPTLRFNHACVFALGGAPMPATLEIDGRASEAPFWTALEAPAGAVLRLGAIPGPTGAGMRAYLGFRQGLDVPLYMGSRSTFTLGRFGGHGGRVLRTGDVLHLLSGADSAPTVKTLPDGLAPRYGRTWTLGVLYGPHGAPDYFRESDIATFFSADWEVHYNSNRTGVRLIGPKPEWARPDGGEAGLHPSNIHDNAYAVGAVDFTGDMPILLGPDGPSLGGFVCPATVVQAELWKLGQLKPGDKVRFRRMSPEEARESERVQEAALANLKADGVMPWAQADAPVFPTAAASRPPSPPSAGSAPAGPAGKASEAVLLRIPATPGREEACFRRSGDRNILVEYGPPVLDINLRFRVHSLMLALQARPPEGLLDLTPGIRSLQVHYDSRIISQEKALEAVVEADRSLPDPADMAAESRIVRMPLSWDDEAIHQVIRKYMQSVRADAPWCPSNIEFIRRINGLGSVDDVLRIVFEASYLVMGLGDVYLGAPVATPLDPRHRLVTTKYNPARTWTVENVVGIGGAYLCIYGMEGPGGYQLFGRTAQVWNTWKRTADFREGKPWLLRFFDQIRFHRVSHAELMDFREAFLRGEAALEVEPATFRLREYNRFLEDNHVDIAAFRDRQRKAFAEERDRWKAAGRTAEAPESAGPVPEPATFEDGCTGVEAHISGNVWKILAAPGKAVEADAPLLVLESMKMEFTVTAPRAGKVKSIACREGSLVQSGQVLVWME
jgi:urea carboxylase